MFGRKMTAELTTAGRKAYGGKMPGYAHEGDAGIDLRSTEPIALEPGETAMAATGIRVAVPDGCVGLLFPRSGLASKRGVTLANAVGVIDSGYRGEIHAPLLNVSGECQGILTGERICQLVVMPFVPVELVAGSMDETERGEGGFGSTGTN